MVVRVKATLCIAVLFALLGRRLRSATFQTGRCRLEGSWVHHGVYQLSATGLPKGLIEISAAIRSGLRLTRVLEDADAYAVGAPSYDQPGAVA